jgi:triacylglycerol lipase
VADLIISAQGTPLEQPLVGLINFGSKAIVWAQQQNPNSLPHDALGAGKSLSQAGSKAFAQKYPLGMPKTSCGEGLAKENGVYFYSFSGNSTLTNILDPDSLLAATGLLMQAPNDNDGLVSRCSAKYGKTVRDNYNWNHLDVINQFFGLRSIFAPDPVDVYRQHANRLKLQGL